MGKVKKPMRPNPMAVNKGGFKQLIILLFVITIEMPRKILCVAKVTKKAGTRNTVTKKPCSAPAPIPTQIAVIIPSTVPAVL